MKITLLLPLAFCGLSLFGQINLKVEPAAAPVADAGIPRTAIASLESAFERKIDRLDSNDPFMRLGATSGVHIPGVGVVFTTAVDLISTPVPTPFQPVIPKATVDKVRQRKTAHLPVLRTAMMEMMKSAASSLGALPPDQKIVIAVRLLYLEYENKTALPTQIVMIADRASALAGTVQTKEQ